MIVFGSSGHAREISFFLNSLQTIEKETISFYVSTELGLLNDVSIIDENQLFYLIRSNDKVFNSIVAIGNGGIRKKVVEKFGHCENLLFPNIFFGNVFAITSIGTGNIFFPTFYSTVNAIIGNHNHFNLKTSISHDVAIGDYNTFSPNVTLAGGVTVGDNNFFGVGASVIDNISICNNVVVGAGAVIVKNITEPGTYVGIPAKKIK